MGHNMSIKSSILISSLVLWLISRWQCWLNHSFPQEVGDDARGESHQGPAARLLHLVFQALRLSKAGHKTTLSQHKRLNLRSLGIQ